ncbi:MAG: S41 family peptidase [Muribaculaceae bacterium]|nr:S41 family peptidase [Muribaculaceae bacterium]
MKLLRNITVAASLMALSLSSCHSIEEWDDDLYGNFDALWTALDEHYCFFADKDVDWAETGARYRAAIDPEWDQQQLFAHCADMLDELRDGHTNLISWFDVSYYRKWWSDYPQNFDERLIQQYYLNFDYHSGGGLIYKYLEDRKVGYVRYASFASTPAHSFIDMMMLSMKDADGMIFDVRDNGGGDLTNVERIVSHFLTERTLAGYITHKTGPGHDDFSEPYPFSYDPAEGHVRWLKPVIILTNRSTFSAANNFVAIMKALPQVAVVGATTGGGSGMPFSSEIPCGWSVRFSASPVYDAQMKLTEHGVDPTPGGEIDLDPVLALDGTDTMMEFAIEVLNRLAEENETRKSPAHYLSAHPYRGKEL